jgi:hypothetical protein
MGNAMQPRRKRPGRRNMRRQVVEAGEQKKNKQDWAQFHGGGPIFLQWQMASAAYNDCIEVRTL